MHSLEASLTRLLRKADSKRSGPLNPFQTDLSLGLRISGLRAEVRSDEHPPPHFHVIYDGEDASYSLQTGLRLPGKVGLERYDGLIYKWWSQNRRHIAISWNKSRPSDCQVGPVVVPGAPAAKAQNRGKRKPRSVS
ncbi:DUF4160 domain-containing protein [Mesorhizobium sp.]|nr:MAG: DUF4160 domain-containing protein [Mesorhizobium sp.]RWP68200.1 MAG: DUF4160 domain-containing protein [Mesorhizobium sp.]RWQ19904.1 MAG: DUF4160 domain-containing protein [Mesorhizobium sp.]